MTRFDAKAWWLFLSPGLLTLLGGVILGIVSAAVFLAGVIAYERMGH